MEKGFILPLMKEPLLKSRWKFLKLAVILVTETVVSLFLPQILGKYIDNLDTKGDAWLMGCALGYCLVVLLRGVVSTCNTYLSEKLGWRLCDCLRVELFQSIFRFPVQRHKTSQEGDFLERIEGDVNLLLNFFSSMLVDIVSCLLMIIGILIVFYTKYIFLGFIFTILTVFILVMFIKTQGWISGLWKKVRERETDVLDEFSQDVLAAKDISGAGKKGYVKERLSERFGKLEKGYKNATFLGNIPSTVFFSMLNVGEGIVLVIGIALLKGGRMTLGEVYLILSYVGLLNAPFFSLKYEFAQMPRVLAALGRIEDIFRAEKNTPAEESGKEEPDKDRSVVFEGVSFGYHAEAVVLREAGFEVKSGEHILIEGRTGGGKSTVLQLIAGFYAPWSGTIRVGGRKIRDYSSEAYHRFLYYIMQNNPILEDTVRNNITRYDDSFSDKEVMEALACVHLKEWVEKQDKGLDEVIIPANISKDEAQLMAWAGAILRKPGILLVDEFDAVIHDDTVRIIDSIISGVLSDSTIIMVTHQKRSSMKIDKHFIMENGKMTRSYR